MARFRYRAKTASGETVTGVLTGESREGVLGRLEGQDLFPVEITPAVPESAEVGWVRWRRRVRPEQVTEFYRQWADLLGAGVPLLVGLASIGAQSSQPALVAVVAALEADVAEGESLAAALARHPGHFSALEVNMVQAAEAGGFLPEVLERVADFREKRQALTGRVKTALAYPAVLLTVGSLVVVFLLLWVVPRFQDIFVHMQAALPAPTRLLLALSDWLSAYGPVLLAAVILALILYRRSRDTERVRELVDRLKLRLPLMGPVVRAVGIARFTRTLGLLLGGGVPVLRSLAISSGGTGNVILQRAVEGCIQNVREGETLAEPLRQTGVVPATVVEMIAIGEQSAKLPAVLERIADGLDAQVDRGLTVLVSLLEPLMIVTMAGLVGFVVFALLLPVFAISSLVQ